MEISLNRNSLWRLIVDQTTRPETCTRQSFLQNQPNKIQAPKTLAEPCRPGERKHPTALLARFIRSSARFARLSVLVRFCGIRRRDWAIDQVLFSSTGDSGYSRRRK